MTVAIPIASLLQGVSQQPTLVRFPDQCELQENAYPSAIDGLQKRQPLKHVGELFDGGAGNALVHVIDRGDTERYAAIFMPSTTIDGTVVAGDPTKSRLRVFDLTDGTEKTVTAPGGGTADFTYLGLPPVAPLHLIGNYDFRDNPGDWSLSAHATALAVSVATIPPLGSRFDGASETTNVYRIGSDATGGGVYTANSGSDWTGAGTLPADGVTFSCFFHRDIASSASGVSLRLRTGGAGGTTRTVLFALSTSGAYTASVTTESNATGLVEEYPNGWFRLSITYIPTTAEIDADLRAQIVMLATPSVSLLAWGARVDRGPTPKDWTLPPSTALRAITVNDYTFIANTTKPCVITSDTTVEDPNQLAGFVFVAAGNYKTNYHIDLQRSGGTATQVEHATWDGNVVSSTLYDTWDFNVGTGSPGSCTMHFFSTGTTESTPVAFTVGASGSATAANLDGAIANWDAANANVDCTHFSANITLRAKSPGIALFPSGSVHFVNGTGTFAISGTTHTVDGTATDSNSIKTDDIATALAAKITALGDGWTATATGSVIKIQNSDGIGGFRDITKIECRDSRGDTNIFSVWSSVASFNTLPLVCEHHHVIKIAGDAVANEDDYYVRFVAEQGSGVGKGYWEEYVKPTNTGASVLVQDTVDASSMPHALIRQSNGTFTFGPLTWSDRVIGDDTTNPIPSLFSDADTYRYIDDLFFWKGRLGFLSGQNVVMSEVNQYFNLWRTTVRALIDSDRIDVTANHTKVAHLRHAVPFDDSLFLFSDHAQFLLTHGEVLSPRSVQIAPTLEYTAEEAARPIASARGIFFSTTRGDYATLQQLVGSQNTQRMDSMDISAHVPRYIPSGAGSLFGTDTESTVAILTDGEPDAIFLYTYSDVGNSRVQSAWHKYTVGDHARVLGGGFIASTLYLVVQRYYGVTLESIRFAPGESDGDLGYVVALDRRIPAGPYTNTPGVYGTDTVWTLPYPIDPSSTFTVVRQDTGAEVTVTQATDGSNVTTLTAAGTDLSAVQVWIGADYTMRYRPSQPAIRESKQSGRSAVIGGRLQALRLRIAYSNSMAFRVTVTPEGKTAEYKDLSETEPVSGYLDTAVGSLSTLATVDITNDTPYPSNLSSLEWECIYSTRSTRTPS